MTDEKDIRYPRGPRVIIEDVTGPPAHPTHRRESVVRIPVRNYDWLRSVTWPGRSGGELVMVRVSRPWPTDAYIARTPLTIPAPLYSFTVEELGACWEEALNGSSYECPDCEPEFWEHQVGRNAVDHHGDEMDWQRWVAEQLIP